MVMLLFRLCLLSTYQKMSTAERHIGESIYPPHFRIQKPLLGTLWDQGLPRFWHPVVSNMTSILCLSVFSLSEN
jgi:hypothetical protein